MGHPSVAPQGFTPSADINILTGGGEMGAIMRAFDWASSPLGPVAHWPQALRTTVSICLNSRSAIFIWWGPEFIMFYNDAYRPVLGDKHPAALGRPGIEYWQEVWHIIGPMLQSVLDTGQATWSDDLQLLLERSGYLEECYFTFSYSPIRDETSSVVGVFTPVLDTTERVLSVRRLQTRRDLATNTAEAQSVEEVYQRAAAALALNSADLPFVIFYALESQSPQARLVTSAGTEPHLPVSPAVVSIEASAPPTGCWPFAQVLQTGTAVIVDDLLTRFAVLPQGGWPAPPHTAVIAPLPPPGYTRNSVRRSLCTSPCLARRPPLPIPSPTRGEGIGPKRLRSFPASRDFRSSLPAVGERQREGAHGVRGSSKFVPNTIGYTRPGGLMIAAVSPRKALDTDYRAFFDRLVQQLVTSLAEAQAVEDQRRRAEALAEIDRAKTLFFTNVSHEFRTPLTLMLGPLEEILVQRAETLTIKRNELALVYRNGVRLLKLVNTLLDFSRIEAGRMQAYYEATDLARVTADLASVFRSACERAGIQLFVACPPLPELVYADRDMWEKIVLNLLSNAFKFTFTGTITVTLATDDTHVVLSVEDTGVGIPATEVPHLFERFHRVYGARGRSQEGTGIGLALVQELTKLHGGVIQVRSEEGQGSCFTVKIPRGCAHLPADRLNTPPALTSTALGAAPYVEEALRWLPDAPAADLDEATVQKSHLPSPAPTQAKKAHRRARILLADDNADLRAYVSRLLSTQYMVTVLPDGLAAWTSILQSPPDLLLADVMMPGLDGFALLQRVRAEARTATLPVMLLSARAGEEARVEGLAAGADDYITKPFSARELLARVAAHLEMARLRHEAARREQELRAEAEAARDHVMRQAEELQQFAYIVSHDLNELLRNIAHLVTFLAEDYEGQLDAQTDSYITRTVAATQRLRQMLKDILAYTRVGGQELTRIPVDGNALLTTVLQDLQVEIAERDATITQDPLPTVPGDPTLLGQVFQNLLSNVLKFRGTAPPRIRVSAVKEEDHWKFAVQDNGIGIDAQQAERVFAVFQRLHPREQYPGTGMDLAICKKIVARHQGRIWMESQPGAGATFYFTIRDEGRENRESPVPLASPTCSLAGLGR